VQVIKAQIGTKGPRVTTNVALNGRYLVLTPFNDQSGISNKIEDPKERIRLAEILRSLTPPSGMGIVIRTAGQQRKLKYFTRDLALLIKEWETIADKMQWLPEPCLLYREPNLARRAVRDFLTDDVDRIVTDSREMYAQMVNDIGDIAPHLGGRIHFHEKGKPLFAEYNVDQQVAQMFASRVALPSGGEIIIEETEALIAIDVNTGAHHRRKDDGSNFILQVNLEAAAEIVRQIRLRNLGGLIIIDFIDMKSRGDKQRVCGAVEEGMAVDTARYQILPISPLGVMQITRQRRSQSVANNTHRPCPYCSGRGTIESELTTAVRVQNALIQHLRREREKNAQRPLSIDVLVHPEVMQFLQKFTIEHFGEIESMYSAQLIFRADSSLHREDFRIATNSKG
jgi:ribonuclease G